VKKITVVSTSVIKSGTSDSGKAWTLYEVTAVNEDGAPIEEKLKSFDKLEGSVEVEVERQDDPKFGTSFMLKLPRTVARRPAGTEGRRGPRPPAGGRRARAGPRAARPNAR
jgi:hypothetical protein